MNGIKALERIARQGIPPGAFFMPKRKIPFLDAVRRFERKQERKEAKQAQRDDTRRQLARARKRERQDAARLVKITHLRRKLRDAAQYPSLFTAKQLSAIAKNPELPAEARVEASRLLMAWLFAEPEELQTPAVHNVRRRKSRRD